MTHDNSDRSDRDRPDSLRQEGDQSNNLQIGNAGHDNTFNINQAQGSHRDQPIKFRRDARLDGPVYENRELTKRSLFTVAAFLLPLVVNALSLIADLLSVGSYFGVRSSWLQLGLFTAPLVTGFVNFDYLRAFIRRPKRVGEYKYLGMGRLLYREDKHTFRVVGFTAPCNVPGCGGLVRMESAPPREKHNGALVGTCDRSRRGHTYEITEDGKGYFRRLDWRPLDEDKQKR